MDIWRRRTNPTPLGSWQPTLWISGAGAPIRRRWYRGNPLYGYLAPAHQSDAVGLVATHFMDIWRRRTNPTPLELVATHFMDIWRRRTNPTPLGSWQPTLWISGAGAPIRRRWAHGNPLYGYLAPAHQSDAVGLLATHFMDIWRRRTNPTPLEPSHPILWISGAGAPIRRRWAPGNPLYGYLAPAHQSDAVGLLATHFMDIWRRRTNPTPVEPSHPTLWISGAGAPIRRRWAPGNPLYGYLAPAHQSDAVGLLATHFMDIWRRRTNPTPLGSWQPTLWISGAGAPIRRRWAPGNPLYGYLAPAHQSDAGGTIAPHFMDIWRRRTNPTPLGSWQPTLWISGAGAPIRRRWAPGNPLYGYLAPAHQSDAVGLLATHFMDIWRRRTNPTPLGSATPILWISGAGAPIRRRWAHGNPLYGYLAPAHQSDAVGLLATHFMDIWRRRTNPTPLGSWQPTLWISGAGAPIRRRWAPWQPTLWISGAGAPIRRRWAPGNPLYGYLAPAHQSDAGGTIATHFMDIWRRRTNPTPLGSWQPTLWISGAGAPIRRRWAPGNPLYGYLAPAHQSDAVGLLATHFMDIWRRRTNPTPLEPSHPILWISGPGAPIRRRWAPGNPLYGYLAPAHQSDAVGLLATHFMDIWRRRTNPTPLGSWQPTLWISGAGAPIRRRWNHRTPLYGYLAPAHQSDAVGLLATHFMDIWRRRTNPTPLGSWQPTLWISGAGAPIRRRWAPGNPLYGYLAPAHQSDAVGLLATHFMDIWRRRTNPTPLEPSQPTLWISGAGAPIRRRWAPGNPLYGYLAPAHQSDAVGLMATHFMDIWRRRTNPTPLGSWQPTLWISGAGAPIRRRVWHQSHTPFYGYLAPAHQSDAVGLLATHFMDIWRRRTNPTPLGSWQPTLWISGAGAPIRRRWAPGNPLYGYLAPAHQSDAVGLMATHFMDIWRRRTNPTPLGSWQPTLWISGAGAPIRRRWAHGNQLYGYLAPAHQSDAVGLMAQPTLWISGAGAPIRRRWAPGNPLYGYLAPAHQSDAVGLLATHFMDIWRRRTNPTPLGSWQPTLWISGAGAPIRRRWAPGNPFYGYLAPAHQSDAVGLLATHFMDIWRRRTNPTPLGSWQPTLWISGAGAPIRRRWNHRTPFYGYLAPGAPIRRRWAPGNPLYGYLAPAHQSDAVGLLATHFMDIWRRRTNPTPLGSWQPTLWISGAGAPIRRRWAPGNPLYGYLAPAHQSDAVGLLATHFMDIWRRRTNPTPVEPSHPILWISGPGAPIRRRWAPGNPLYGYLAPAHQSDAVGLLATHFMDIWRRRTNPTPVEPSHPILWISGPGAPIRRRWARGNPLYGYLAPAHQSDAAGTIAPHFMDIWRRRTNPTPLGCWQPTLWISGAGAPIRRRWARGNPLYGYLAPAHQSDAVGLVATHFMDIWRRRTNPTPLEPWQPTLWISGAGAPIRRRWARGNPLYGYLAPAHQSDAVGLLATHFMDIWRRRTNPTPLGSWQPTLWISGAGAPIRRRWAPGNPLYGYLAPAHQSDAVGLLATHFMDIWRRRTNPTPLGSWQPTLWISGAGAPIRRRWNHRTPLYGYLAPAHQSDAVGLLATHFMDIWRRRTNPTPLGSWQPTLWISGAGAPIRRRWAPWQPTLWISGAGAPIRRRWARGNPLYGYLAPAHQSDAVGLVATHFMDIWRRRTNPTPLGSMATHFMDIWRRRTNPTPLGWWQPTLWISGAGAPIRRRWAPGNPLYGYLAPAHQSDAVGLHGNPLYGYLAPAHQSDAVGLVATHFMDIWRRRTNPTPLGSWQPTLWISGAGAPIRRRWNHRTPFYGYLAPAHQSDAVGLLATHFMDIWRRRTNPTPLGSWQPTLWISGAGAPIRRRWAPGNPLYGYLAPAHQSDAVGLLATHFMDIWRRRTNPTPLGSWQPTLWISGAGAPIRRRWNHGNPLYGYLAPAHQSDAVGLVATHFMDIWRRRTNPTPLGSWQPTLWISGAGAPIRRRWARGNPLYGYLAPAHQSDAVGLVATHFMDIWRRRTNPTPLGSWQPTLWISGAGAPIRRRWAHGNPLYGYLAPAHQSDAVGLVATHFMDIWRRRTNPTPLGPSQPTLWISGPGAPIRRRWARGNPLYGYLAPAHQSDAVGLLATHFMDIWRRRTNPTPLGSWQPTLWISGAGAPIRRRWNHRNPFYGYLAPAHQSDAVGLVATHFMDIWRRRTNPTPLGSWQPTLWISGAGAPIRRRWARGNPLYGYLAPAHQSDAVGLVATHFMDIWRRRTNPTPLGSWQPTLWISGAGAPIRRRWAPGNPFYGYLAPAHQSDAVGLVATHFMDIWRRRTNPTPLGSSPLYGYLAPAHQSDAVGLVATHFMDIWRRRTNPTPLGSWQPTLWISGAGAPIRRRWAPGNPLYGYLAPAHQSDAVGLVATHFMDIWRRRTNPTPLGSWQPTLWISGAGAPIRRRWARGNPLYGYLVPAHQSDAVGLVATHFMDIWRRRTNPTPLGSWQPTLWISGAGAPIRRRWARGNPLYGYLAPAHQSDAGGTMAPHFMDIWRRRTNPTPLGSWQPTLWISGAGAPIRRRWARGNPFYGYLAPAHQSDAVGLVATHFMDIWRRRTNPTPLGSSGNPLYGYLAPAHQSDAVGLVATHFMDIWRRRTNPTPLGSWQPTLWISGAGAPIRRRWARGNPLYGYLAPAHQSDAVGLVATHFMDIWRRRTNPTPLEPWQPILWISGPGAPIRRRWARGNPLYGYLAPAHQSDAVGTIATHFMDIWSWRGNPTPLGSWQPTLWISGAGAPIRRRWARGNPLYGYLAPAHQSDAVGLVATHFMDIWRRRTNPTPLGSWQPTLWISGAGAPIRRRWARGNPLYGYLAPAHQSDAVGLVEPTLWISGAGAPIRRRWARGNPLYGYLAPAHQSDAVGLTVATHFMDIWRRRTNPTPLGSWQPTLWISGAGAPIRRRWARGNPLYGYLAPAHQSDAVGLVATHFMDIWRRRTNPTPLGSWQPTLWISGAGAPIRRRWARGNPLYGYLAPAHQSDAVGLVATHFMDIWRRRTNPTPLEPSNPILWISGPGAPIRRRWAPGNPLYGYLAPAHQSDAVGLVATHFMDIWRRRTNPTPLGSWQPTLWISGAGAPIRRRWAPWQPTLWISGAGAPIRRRWAPGNPLYGYLAPAHQSDAVGLVATHFMDIWPRRTNPTPLGSWQPTLWISGAGAPIRRRWNHRNPLYGYLAPAHQSDAVGLVATHFMDIWRRRTNPTPLGSWQPSHPILWISGPGAPIRRRWARGNPLYGYLAPAHQSDAVGLVATHFMDIWRRRTNPTPLGSWQPTLWISGAGAPIRRRWARGNPLYGYLAPAHQSDAVGLVATHFMDIWRRRTNPTPLEPWQPILWISGAGAPIRRRWASWQPTLWISGAGAPIRRRWAPGNPLYGYLAPAHQSDAVGLVATHFMDIWPRRTNPTPLGSWQPTLWISGAGAPIRRRWARGNPLYGYLAPAHQSDAVGLVATHFMDIWRRRTNPTPLGSWQPTLWISGAGAPIRRRWAPGNPLYGYLAPAHQSDAVGLVATHFMDIWRRRTNPTPLGSWQPILWISGAGAPIRRRWARGNPLYGYLAPAHQSDAGGTVATHFFMDIWRRRTNPTPLGSWQPTLWISGAGAPIRRRWARGNPLYGYLAPAHQSDAVGLVATHFMDIWRRRTNPTPLGSWQPTLWISGAGAPIRRRWARGNPLYGYLAPAHQSDAVGLVATHFMDIWRRRTNPTPLGSWQPTLWISGAGAPIRRRWNHRTPFYGYLAPAHQSDAVGLVATHFMDIWRRRTNPTPLGSWQPTLWISGAGAPIRRRWARGNPLYGYLAPAHQSDAVGLVATHFMDIWRRRTNPTPLGSWQPTLWISGAGAPIRRRWARGNPLYGYLAPAHQSDAVGLMGTHFMDIWPPPHQSDAVGLVATHFMDIWRRRTNPTRNPLYGYLAPAHQSDAVGARGNSLYGYLASAHQSDAVGLVATHFMDIWRRRTNTTPLEPSHLILWISGAGAPIRRRWARGNPLYGYLAPAHQSDAVGLVATHFMDIWPRRTNPTPLGSWQPTLWISGAGAPIRRRWARGNPLYGYLAPAHQSDADGLVATHFMDIWRRRTNPTPLGSWQPTLWISGAGAPIRRRWARGNPLYGYLAPAHQSDAVGLVATHFMDIWRRRTNPTPLGSWQPTLWISGPGAPIRRRWAPGNPLYGYLAPAHQSDAVGLVATHFMDIWRRRTNPTPLGSWQPTLWISGAGAPIRRRWARGNPFYGYLAPAHQSDADGLVATHFMDIWRRRTNPTPLGSWQPTLWISGAGAPIRRRWARGNPLYGYLAPAHQSDAVGLVATHFMDIWRRRTNPTPLGSWQPTLWISGPGAPIRRRWARGNPLYGYLAPAHQSDAGGTIAPHFMDIWPRRTNPTPLGSWQPTLWISGAGAPIRRRWARGNPLYGYLASAHQSDAVGLVATHFMDIWRRRTNPTPLGSWQPTLWISGAGAPIRRRWARGNPLYGYLAPAHQSDAVGLVATHFMDIWRRRTNPTPLGSWQPTLWISGAGAPIRRRWGSWQLTLWISGLRSPIRRRWARGNPLYGYLAPAHQSDAVGTIATHFMDIWPRRTNPTPLGSWQPTLWISGPGAPIRRRWARGNPLYGYLAPAHQSDAGGTIPPHFMDIWRRRTNPTPVEPSHPILWISGAGAPIRRRRNHPTPFYGYLAPAHQSDAVGLVATHFMDIWRRRTNPTPLGLVATHFMDIWPPLTNPTPMGSWQPTLWISGAGAPIRRRWAPGNPFYGYLVPAHQSDAVGARGNSLYGYLAPAHQSDAVGLVATHFMDIWRRRTNPTLVYPSNPILWISGAGAPIRRRWARGNPLYGYLAPAHQSDAVGLVATHFMDIWRRRTNPTPLGSWQPILWISGPGAPIRRRWARGNPLYGYLAPAHQSDAVGLVATHFMDIWPRRTNPTPQSDAVGLVATHFMDIWRRRTNPTPLGSWQPTLWISGAGAPIRRRWARGNPLYGYLAPAHQSDAGGLVATHFMDIWPPLTNPTPMGSWQPTLWISGPGAAIRRRWARGNPLYGYLASAHQSDPGVPFEPYFMDIWPRRTNPTPVEPSHPILWISGAGAPIRRRWARGNSLYGYLASAHQSDADGLVATHFMDIWRRRTNPTPVEPSHPILWISGAGAPIRRRWARGNLTLWISGPGAPIRRRWARGNPLYGYLAPEHQSDAGGTIAPHFMDIWGSRTYPTPLCSWQPLFMDIWPPRTNPTPLDSSQPILLLSGL
ncbi:hypothetical protein RB195_023047 [Necator americanus]|uniref:Uncharacterized protein n=1 Tax=Necator americanus TaxID=51031 RepID=A0ABR1EHM8_NECAM